VNFRTDPSSSVENCSNPTQGHIAPPFKDGSLDARTKKVGAGPPVELPLRVKNKSDLGDVELTFYYDICLGNTKADPRLIVER
jgi:hypothetical protein